MADYPDDPDEATVQRREALHALFVAGRDEEAADYALGLDTRVGMFSPLEALADRLGNRRPDLARRLYAAALEGAREFASWATGGAEGLARMGDVHRIQRKIDSTRAGEAR